MTADEVYSLEKRCSRGEIILVNPKDWHIYDIFLEDDDTTITVHRCIDPETHEDEPIWSGTPEEVTLDKWDQILFNEDLTLFVFKELKDETNPG